MGAVAAIQSALALHTTGGGVGARCGGVFSKGDPMNISRAKFIILFLVFGFAFLFASTGLLEQPPESFFGADSQSAWQSLVSKVLSPIKLVLIGPLVPMINVLNQDPDTPPPFFLAMFAGYWAILAFAIHYLLGRRRVSVTR